MLKWKVQSVLRLLVAVIVILFALYFIYLVRGVLLSFLLAVVPAYLLYPLVLRVEKRGGGRTLAILVVYLAVLIFGAGLLLYGVPVFTAQLQALIVQMPDYVAQLQELTIELQQKYARAGIPEPLRQSIDQRLDGLGVLLVDQAERALGVVINWAGYFFNLILVPIIAFYLLRDVEQFRCQIVGLIPAHWRMEVVRLGSEISGVIDSFVRGYLLISVLTGILSGVALAALGVDFPLMLGIFAGITNLIPYFGPLIGAIPAVAVAFLVSKWLALQVVVVYLVIQQLEAAVIAPRILGPRVGLHPLLVILALLAGGQLYGLLGLVLAVPVAAIARELIGFVRPKLFPGQRSP